MPSVDHNQYIRDGTLYQSNYMAGFRVYDVSSIPRDPSGNTVCEVRRRSNPSTPVPC